MYLDMQTPSKKFKSDKTMDEPSFYGRLGLVDAIKSNLPVDSPKPLLHILNKQNRLTTKKERLQTPRLVRKVPKPLARSFLKSRLSTSNNTSLNTSQKAHVITFLPNDNKNDSFSSHLSEHYDENLSEWYIKQCFVIEQRLGSGSFADVFKVRSKDDDRCYAIKVSREKFRGRKDREKKLNEVAKHQQLPEHPHLVKYFLAWEERQRLFIQTELCEMSLDTFSALNHDISEATIMKFFVDILKAVDRLHNQDLVHLDIKPENIFISQNGACKLGDFGLIYDLKNDTQNEATDGDPKYLASEVIQGIFTKAADIFALGMTILELATDLDLPNGGQCWHDLREERISQEFLDKMSPELQAIIKKMLHPDHECRPSVTELLSCPYIVLYDKQRQSELQNAANTSLSRLIQQSIQNADNVCIENFDSKTSPLPRFIAPGQSPIVSSSASFHKNNISAYFDQYADSSEEDRSIHKSEDDGWVGRVRANSFSDSEDNFVIPMPSMNRKIREESIKSVSQKLIFDFNDDNSEHEHEETEVMELTEDDESSFVPQEASTCNQGSRVYSLRSRDITGKSLAQSFYDLDDDEI